MSLPSPTKPTRISRPPIAWYPLEISPELWEKAEKEGQPSQHQGHNIKHTEELREYAEAILGKLEAELRQELVTEGDMRTLLRSLQQALLMLGRLWGSGPEEERLRRAVGDGLLQHVNECASRPEQQTPSAVLQERAHRLRLVLPRSPGELAELAGLCELAVAAVGRARSKSDAPMTGGQETSLLESALKALGWVYVEAGGRVRGGSNFSVSFFARWAFAILQALPSDLAALFAVSRINNLIRNMDWSDLRRPSHLV